MTKFLKVRLYFDAVEASFFFNSEESRIIFVFLTSYKFKCERQEKKDNFFYQCGKRLRRIPVT